MRASTLTLTAVVLASCAGGEVAGNEGAAGTTGAAGSAAGTTGTAGTTGAAGTAGTTGSSGTTGTAGTGGSVGAAGSSAAGTSGGRGGTVGTAGTGGTGGSVGAAGQGGAAGYGGSTGRAGNGGRGGTSGGGTGGTSVGGSGGGVAGTTGTGGVSPVKKYVGNIDTRGQVRSDFSMYWDQVTPENAGKWGSIEGTKDKMNWTALDAIHTYAQQHHIPFKQHNFVWGSQQPGWIGGLSQTEQAAQVEEWIRLFCERYPDTQLIDVINEPPPHTTPPYVAALGGAGKSGYDWMAQVFKWAHQYCPSSILLLNDYNNIEQSGDNQRTITMVNAIKSAGGTIHGVGAQAHGCANLSASAIQKNIDNIKSMTGLPVYISEYDLNIADDTQQKNVMQSQFTMFWNDANVAGITIWGYIEGATWETNSGLMSSSGTMRPAMSWLMGFLGR